LPMNVGVLYSHFAHFGALLARVGYSSDVCWLCQDAVEASLAWAHGLLWPMVLLLREVSIPVSPLFKVQLVHQTFCILSKMRLSASLLTSFAVFGHLACAARPYSSWMADSVIARKEARGLNSTGSPLLTYEHGVFQRALEMLYNKTSNATYLNYIQEGLDNVVNSDGSLNTYSVPYSSLDPLRVGENLLFL
jgi:hypothetical protein